MKYAFFIFALLLLPLPALAEYGMVDALSLAPFVPLVLEAMMIVAMSGYKFFVGDGTGIIYILVWGWLAITICLYLVRLFLPAEWLAFAGLSGNDALAKGEVSGFKMGEELLKPGLRAIFAIVILLQVKPQYISTYVVDPFLQFGATYTESIEGMVARSPFGVAPPAKCPDVLVLEGYISERGCDFLVQPVATITHVNNALVKRGFQMLTKGFSGLMSLLLRGPDGFLNIITGLVLITTFVTSNFFMALLIIQGIFNFGMALILYPFKVLMYVAKPADKNAWFDPWNAFDELVPALKNLVITMIASMFIMAVNVAVVSALFRWNQSVFSDAAGGAAHSNLPVAASGGIGFGNHATTWLSAVLTLFIMVQIFNMTREQLEKYTKDTGNDLYKKVAGDSKATWEKTKDWTSKGFGVAKKIFGK
ncbi:MAG: hypothetical protein FWG39_03240 [Alphaproteobacteria bacterium]|nr:hypothetical protein [Alphaproteobacteria bacterium]